jgi:hypothetical protein
MHIRLQILKFYSVCASIFALVLIRATAVFGQTPVQSSVISEVKESTQTGDFLRVTDLEKSSQPQPTDNFLRVIDLEQEPPVSPESANKSPNSEQTSNFLRVVDFDKPSPPETPNQPATAEETNSKNQEVTKTPAVSPVTESTPSSLSQSALIPPVDPNSVAAKWDVLPIGIQVSGRAAVKSALVRGSEDGSQAINFDDWLVPYETMIKALNIRVTNLPNGQVQLRSPTVAFNLDLSRLRLDPEIGAVLSIRDLKDWFGITPEFDINNYAIQINYPRTNQSDFSKAPVEPSIDFTNIPYISAPPFTVTTVNNQEETQNSSGNTSQNRTVTSSGSLLGGAWLLSINQSQTKNADILRLGSASYTRQEDSTDLFIGSQSRFWRSTSPNPFWGVTIVKRRGFTMSPGSGGSANNRIQPQRFGQTVRGKAEPGTLVQLLYRYSPQILAEVLVDQTGEYSFNDIILSEVRLLLYPQGKLTSQPEERIITLPIIIGQLPSQDSTLTIAVGTGRSNSSNSKEFLGTFKDLQTAASYRYGISQELTVEVGSSYENGFRGFTELFFQPENTPLQITASALTPTTNKDWEANANIRYNPTPKIQANLATDLQRSSLQINQKILSNLSVFSNFNYNYTASSPFRYNIGTRTNLIGQKYSGSLTLQWDSVGKLQWNLTGRKGNLGLKHFVNNFSTQTNLTYDLLNNPNSTAYNSDNTLVLNYQTLAPLRVNSTGNSLLTLSWQYKPENSKFQVELGYGLGSSGSGFIAKLSHEILSGLFLQANYSNVGLGSNTEQLRLSLSSSSCFDFQRGFCLKDSFQDTPRIANGIVFKPFLDINNNGTREPIEPLIVKKLDSLLIVNNNPGSKYQLTVTTNGIVASLEPGLYRLDLDPSAYPLDWFPTKNTAVGIEVFAGGFTEVVIPFTKSYTISGTVTDSQGKPVSGAKVEAVSSTSNQRVFSITGSDGTYYLEGLIDYSYNLFINNTPAEPKTIDLRQFYEPEQQLNLRFMPENI